VEDEGQKKGPRAVVTSKRKKQDERKCPLGRYSHLRRAHTPTKGASPCCSDWRGNIEKRGAEMNPKPGKEKAPVIGGKRKTGHGAQFSRQTSKYEGERGVSQGKQCVGENLRWNGGHYT